jgi:hypothetical protein
MSVREVCAGSQSVEHENAMMVASPTIAIVRRDRGQRVAKERISITILVRSCTARDTR